MFEWCVCERACSERRVNDPLVDTVRLNVSPNGRLQNQGEVKGLVGSQEPDCSFSFK